MIILGDNLIHYLKRVQALALDFFHDFLWYLQLELPSLELFGVRFNNLPYDILMNAFLRLVTGCFMVLL